ncbi:MAG: hypothetical protein QW649_04980 [Thermoplasmata archaeon]
MEKKFYLGRRKVRRDANSIAVTIARAYVYSVDLKEGDFVEQYITDDGSLLIKKVEAKNNENIKGDQNGK